MSQTHKQALALLLIFTVALALSPHALAGREIPQNPNIIDAKFLVGHDGSYLIPGIGRFMFPKKGRGHNPFAYNPVTGTDSGVNTGVRGDSSGRTSHSQIPGADDTFLPSPDVGILIPRFGGSPPSPASP